MSSPISLIPLSGGQAANKCTCISPTMYVNGYIDSELIPADTIYELDVINKLVLHMMPQISYYASRYQKDNKVKPRVMFSDKSPFIQDVLLPMLFDVTAFEGVPLYLTKEGAWAAIHKFGLIYCQFAFLVAEKSKSLTERLSTSEWANTVKSILKSVTNSGVFDPYFIFPISAIGSDIFWDGGFSFNLMSNNNLSISINSMKYLHTIKDSYNKEPDYLILTRDSNGQLKFSFTYDFSQSGGAKALYSFALDVHDKFPDFDYYRYTGKSDPFYYPLTCYSK